MEIHLENYATKKKSVYTQTSHLLHIILPIQSLPIWFLPYENKRKEKQSFYAEVYNLSTCIL